jgi:hypothetical protein
MADYRTEPLYKPPLRPHRLIPAGPGAVPLEGLPVGAIGREVESWLAASSEAPNAVLEEGGRILARQAWLFIEKAALTLDALPAVFRSADTPDEAFEALALLGSILLTLPDLMASGVEGNVARVDWMFSRVLNAPAQPGVVEQVIEALAALDTSRADDQPPADHSAELEVLRGLHRDLVTLQQRWDALIESLFPMVFPTPASPPAGNSGKTQPVDVPAGMLADPRALKTPGPLPAGLMITDTGSPEAAPRSARFHMAGKQQRLALVLVLVLLALTIIGMLLAQTRSVPAIIPGSAALSVTQPTSSPTTAAQPTAPPTTPRPTPTPRRPQPTPSQPTPRPTPASGLTCPRGAALCISTTTLQVPCAGDGSVMFQLTNATTSKEGWQALSTTDSGVALVEITPAHGMLKQNQTVTLSVQANTQREDRSGAITIFGPLGTLPISITVQVCS